MYGSFKCLSHVSHWIQGSFLHYLGHESLDVCPSAAKPLQCSFICLHKRIDGNFKLLRIIFFISYFSLIFHFNLKGDIASASGSFLYLWNINGEPLASVNTIPSHRNHVILSIYMSQVNEWDQNNVIMTGGTDGVIRVKLIKLNILKL